MKVCNRCRESKPLDAFYLSKGRPTSPCKACAIRRAAERNRADPEAHQRARKKWLESGGRAMKNQRSLERQKAMRQAAPELVRERERLWYAGRKDEIAAQKRALRAQNPEATKAARDRYNRSEYGRTMMRVRQHHRRASELQATPLWYDAEAVRQYFEVARVLSRSGVQFSVDHAVPLKGRNVCGLHVQDNLQVMPLLQNIRKHNKLEEGCCG